MAKYQAYAEYKDSGVEWLGEVPSYWNLKRLKETVTLVNGYPFNSNNFNFQIGIPLIRIRDIYNSIPQIFFNGYVPYEAMVSNGDILIGMDGDFNVCEWQGADAALNQRVCCIRARNNILKKFIYYLLPIKMKIINDLTYFTTVKHLSSLDVLKIIYALPSPQEYTKIVNFLDYETAKIDTLIAKQKKLIELLKEKCQAVISHAVTKGLDPNVKMKASGVEWLGDVPEHWSVKPLKRIINLMEQGKSPECENTEALLDQWGVLKTSCVNNGLFCSHKNKALPKHIHPHVQYQVKANDVLMSRASGSIDLIGSVAIVPKNVQENLLLSDKIFRIYLDRSNDPNYFTFLMATPYMRKLIERSISGAEGMANNIKKTAILEFISIFPPLNEQVDLVRYLKKEIQSFDLLVNKAQLAIKLMQERRTALISSAVTGKIDVRDWQKPQEA